MRRLAKSVWILPGCKKRRPFFLLSHTPEISVYHWYEKTTSRGGLFFYMCFVYSSAPIFRSDQLWCQAWDWLCRFR
jgi:hypothetical protein